MNADVYSSLMKGLIMSDIGDISYYPVRTSAAGAITGLLEVGAENPLIMCWWLLDCLYVQIYVYVFALQNDYLPLEWMPLLQVVVNRIGNDDDESSILYQLLNSVVEAGGENIAAHIPDIVPILAGTLSKSIPDNLEPWPQVRADPMAIMIIALSSLNISWSVVCFINHLIIKFTSHNYSSDLRFGPSDSLTL